MVAAKKITQSKNKRRDIISVFILIGIIALTNFVGSFYFKRFDLTSEKRYTLAESTKTLLTNLDDEVYFKVYFDGDFNPSFTRLRNEAKEILDEFRAYSGNQIQYEFIVPGEGLNTDEKSNLEKQLYEKGLVPEEVFEKNKDKNTLNLFFFFVLLCLFFIVLFKFFLIYDIFFLFFVFIAYYSAFFLRMIFY